MSKIQRRLNKLLIDLPERFDKPWRYNIVDVGAGGESLVIHRFWQTLSDGARLFLNMLEPDAVALPYLHPHGKWAAHLVLGPGPYEMGWGYGGELHGRLVVPGTPWYYEMLTEDALHYIRCLGPQETYSIALWADYEPTLHADSKKMIRENPQALVPPARDFDWLLYQVQQGIAKIQATEEYKTWKSKRRK